MSFSSIEGTVVPSRRLGIARSRQAAPQPRKISTKHPVRGGIAVVGAVALLLAGACSAGGATEVVDRLRVFGMPRAPL